MWKFPVTARLEPLLTLTPAADWKLRSTISDDGSGSCFRRHATHLRRLSCNWLRHWTGGARMLGRSLVFVACFLPRLAFQGSSLCPTWLQLCPSPISPVPFAQKNPPSSFRASSGTCQETGEETTDKIPSSALLVLTPWILQHLLLPPSSFHHRWRQSGSHLFPERRTTLPTSSPRKKKRSFFIR